MTDAAEQFDAPEDIGRQAIATTYAKALLGVTETGGNTDSVLEELDSLVKTVLPQHPQFAEALRTPRLSVEEKIGLIDRIFGSRASGELLKFLKVLANHGRLDCLREIASAFRRQVNDKQGRVAVQVTTASELSAEQLGQVNASLHEKLGRQIDLTTRVDEELLGGMVVRIGDTVIDGSLKNRLVRLQQKTIDDVSAKLQKKFETDAA